MNTMPTSSFAIYTFMMVLLSMINGYLIARCIDALREEREWYPKMDPTEFGP